MLYYALLFFSLLLFSLQLIYDSLLFYYLPIDLIIVYILSQLKMVYAAQ